MIRRWHDVSVQFKGPEGKDNCEERAEVRLGEGEMVIDIPHRYLVVGEKVKDYFAGVDSLAHEVRVDVKARWALLGDIYVGIWVEDGAEYLFSFRLPRTTAPRTGT